MAIRVRTLRDTDSLALLTDLLHRAYRPLALRGLHFLATHQSEQTTRERCMSGVCLVAELDARLIGTITYYPADCTSGSPWLDRVGTASFGQLAVEPDLQGTGLGRRLTATVEDRARADGAEELALDTALAARDLVAWYERLGYRRIELVSWSVTNYRSVIMSKTIGRPHLAGGTLR